MKRDCKTCENAYWVYGCEFGCKYYDNGECDDKTLSHYQSEKPKDIKIMASDIHHASTNKEILIMASDIHGATSKVPYLEDRIEIAKALYILGYRSKDEIQSIVKTANKEVLQEFAERLKTRLIMNNEENYKFFDYDYTLETIDELLKKY